MEKEGFVSSALSDDSAVVKKKWSACLLPITINYMYVGDIREHFAALP